MRHLLRIVFAALAVGAFVQAARTAAHLRESTGALARAHTWRDVRPAPVPEPIADVAPATLEAEEAPRMAPVRPIVKRKKLSPPPMIAVPEVEPEDAIRLALRGKRASFERCYENELKKQAAFSGYFLVAVSVSAKGQVLEAKVQEANRRDAIVGACIVAAMRTIRLPLLTSDADLLIPIRLEAKEPT